MHFSQQHFGQKVWVDYVARTLLADGTLLQRIDDWAVTGVSLRPYSVCKALEESDVYDVAISSKLDEGISGDFLVSALIVDDARRTADLLRQVFDRSEGVEGWVIVPVSPLKITDSNELKEAVIALQEQLERPNVLISIPGCKEFSDLLEELVFLGIPINISLICSHGQYLNAAEAYMKGIERRMDKGLAPVVSVFASVSICSLAAVFATGLSRGNVLQASIAVATRIYESMKTLYTSKKWERAYNGGARFLKIIWINGLDENPVNYWAPISHHLIAPYTISSIPEIHLEEFVKSIQAAEPMPGDGADCDRILTDFQKGGLDVENIGEGLQKNLAELQVKIWITLLDMMAKKSASLIQIQPS